MELVNNHKWDQSVIGRTLAEDVVSPSGHFLLKKGTVLSGWHLTILRNHKIEDVSLEEKKEAPVKVQLRQIFRHNEEISDKYEKNVEEIKELFQEAISREVPSLQTFMKPYKPLLETVLEGPDIFLELRHIKGHDEYTYRHSINTGLLASTIGKILRLPHSDTITLGIMGFLHDIGKMKVSPQLLNKDSQLSDMEFNEIKKHPIYGKEILTQMDGVYDELIEGVLYHHERLDGSGYPFGLKNGQIPFLSQIIAVADVYDAISSDRVYRDKFAPFESLQELIKEVYNGKIEGTIVFPFTEHILNGYIGREVRLNDGTEGKIVQLYMDEIQRPLIKTGNTFIDLRQRRGSFIRDVLLPGLN